MQNAKPIQPSPPLIQLAWITKKNGRTTVGIFTLGFPFAAGIALLCSGAHLDFVRKILKVVTISTGIGR